MSGQGGPGRGQGRKRFLTRTQEIRLGVEFVNRWTKLAESNEMEKYGRTKTARRVKAQQAKMQIQVKERKTARGQQRADEVNEKIDEATKRWRRARRLPVKRPRGYRAKIIQECIDWCRDKFGIEVTPRRIKDCIPAGRKFLKDRV